MLPAMPTSREGGTVNMGFAQTLDAIIGVLSPTSQERRMQARANVGRDGDKAEAETAEGTHGTAERGI